MNKVFIILLNYNGYNDTFECIESIKKNLDLNKYEIVVIDNNSTDDSYVKLKKIKNIILLKSDVNNGFSAGNNIGIKYALRNKAEYIILLNNDTVVTKNCFDPMINIMNDNEDIGILGCKVLYYDEPNKINCYGGSINLNRGTVLLGYGDRIDSSEISNFEYTEFISGCCMMIRKNVFQDVGLLPEEYFMYYEDADFCLNVSKLFKLAVCDSKIYHKVSSSSGGRESYFSIKWNTRNRIIFINNYCSKIKAYAFFNFTRIIILAKYILSFKFSLAKAVIDGIKEGRKFIYENKKI